MLPLIYMLWSIECFDFSILLFKEVTGEPEEECVWVSVCVCVCGGGGRVHAYIVIVKYFPCIWVVFSSVFHWVVDVLLLILLNVFM